MDLGGGPFTPPRRVAREAKETYFLDQFFAQKSSEECASLAFPAATEYVGFTSALCLYLAGDGHQPAAVPEKFFFRKCACRRRCQGTWVCSSERTCCPCWTPDMGANPNRLPRIARSLEPDGETELDVIQELLRQGDAELQDGRPAPEEPDEMDVGDLEGEDVEREWIEEDYEDRMWGVIPTDGDFVILDEVSAAGANMHDAFEAASRTQRETEELQGDVEGTDVEREWIEEFYEGRSWGTSSSDGDLAFLGEAIAAEADLQEAFENASWTRREQEGSQGDDAGMEATLEMEAMEHWQELLLQDPDLYVSESERSEWPSLRKQSSWEISYSSGCCLAATETVLPGQ